jgi:hypothetical protein
MQKIGDCKTASGPAIDSARAARLRQGRRSTRQDCVRVGDGLGLPYLCNGARADGCENARADVEQVAAAAGGFQCARERARALSLSALCLSLSLPPSLRPSLSPSLSPSLPPSPPPPLFLSLSLPPSLPPSLPLSLSRERACALSEMKSMARQREGRRLH